MAVELVGDYKTIECHVDERGVATINLNGREVYNAFDELMIVELTRCVSLLFAEQCPSSGTDFNRQDVLRWR